MKVGDYLEMQAEQGVWYGEIVGITPTSLEVYFIEKGQDNVWTYSEEWHEVPKECVLKHIKTENVITALRELGFRPLTDSTFARLDEQGNVPLGDPAFDEEDDDEDLEGFIVPDHEGEAFSLAQNDSEFVRETHQAVRDFNQWHPQGEAQRVKNFIEGLANRTITAENARTRLGEGISYNNPPI